MPEKNPRKDDFLHAVLNEGKSFDEADTGIDAIINQQIVLNKKSIGVVEIRPWAGGTGARYEGMRGIYFNSSEDAGKLFSAKDSTKIKLGKKSLNVAEFKKEYLSEKALPIYTNLDILKSDRAAYAAHIGYREALSRDMEERRKREAQADAIRQEAIDNGWQ